MIVGLDGNNGITLLVEYLCNLLLLLNSLLLLEESLQLALLQDVERDEAYNDVYWLLGKRLNKLRFAQISPQDG